MAQFRVYDANVGGGLAVTTAALLLHRDAAGSDAAAALRRPLKSAAESHAEREKGERLRGRIRLFPATSLISSRITHPKAKDVLPGITSLTYPQYKFLENIVILRQTFVSNRY